MKKLSHYPTGVQQALVSLGRTIANARKQKRVSRDELAARIGISPVTLLRIEQGHPGVAVGNVFKALWVLDLPMWPSLDVPVADEIRQLLAKSDLMPARADKRRKFDDNF